MKSTASASVAVALIVALAGCMGSLGAIAGAESAAYPPGVDETGVTDVSELLYAHEEALYTNGFELTANVATETTNDTMESTTTVSVSPDGTFLLTQNDMAGDDTFERVVYGDQQTAYERQTYGDDVTYSGYNVEATYGELTRLDLVAGLLDSVPFEVTESNGVTVLEATDATIRNDDGDKATVTATVTIRENGLIESLTADVQSGSGDEAITNTIDMTVETGNVAVSKPGWVTAKASEMTMVDLSFALENGALVVTHEGGDVIPSGSELYAQFVDDDGEQDMVVAVLDQDLKPGQKVTVYNGEDVLTTAYIGQHDKPDDTTAITGNVQVSVYNGPETVEIGFVTSDEE
ncbi:hypothetical protein [Haloarchaeobius sp. DFWS5]|uniref:hypothetical protein n=1 Tax=Haloarchaeobius sp. DFWS5 TaxID=3446114 RepID=UPI003EBA5A4E